MEAWSRVLRREVKRSPRVAVLGVGHAARGDDAVGTLIARDLLASTPPLPPEALIVAAGEAPENFTGVVRAFCPDLTIIIDAGRGGRPPGAVFVIDPADVADEDVSTHRIPLIRLIRYLRETMGCRVLLIGIEPATFEGGKEGAVSPAVGRAVRAVSRALRRALIPA